MKLVRRIRRDTDGLARSHHRFRAAESCFNLAFEDSERFLEIMAMRGWSSAGRDMHIDEAIAASGVLAVNKIV